MNLTNIFSYSKGVLPQGRTPFYIVTKAVKLLWYTLYRLHAELTLTIFPEFRGSRQLSAYSSYWWPAVYLYQYHIHESA